MDLKFIQIIVLLSCAALSLCQVSQQKLTGDESSLSSDTQVTESTFTSSGSAGSSRSSSSPSSSSLSSSSSSTTASPSPYSFAYNTADVAGNQLVRQEAGDANGAVRGRYGYQDADGLYRTVEYIADANGFRAAIRSNEPGLGNSADVNGIPASVFLQTEATPTKVVSKVASASLARLRVAQNTLATALPTTTTTTRRPVAVFTAAPTARPSILASLTPLSATKGGATAPVGIAVARVTPVAAARANSVRQSVRLPSTLRLVSSQVVPLQRLVPLTTSTTTTTTTTTTEAPATVSQQFLSGQQDDQQVKSSDEQDQSDSLSSDQQVQTDQQSASDDQQEQVKFVQPDQPIQPQTVQQKQTDQQTDSSPTQPEANFTDNDEAGESLPSTPVQPQIQTQIQPQIQPQVPPQIQIQPQVQTQIQPEIRETQPEAQPETQPEIQPEIQSEIQPQPQIQTQIPIQPLPPPTTGPVAHENPLLVRFLDEDLTYDSLEFPHIEPQPRTIAVQTDEHPLSRLYRIVPIPHHESLRLHKAGANMMYLTSAQSYGPNYQNY